MSDYLFVYGTLIPGREPAHLASLCSRFESIGSATVRGRLYDMGSYPAATLEPGSIIHGHLLPVPDEKLLSELDVYEGCPTLFARVRTRATLENGRETDCWIYVFAQDCSAHPAIESGRWSR